VEFSDVKHPYEICCKIKRNLVWNDRILRISSVGACAESAVYSLTNLAALVAVQGVAIFISAVGLLFVVGNLYRQLKRLLCYGSSGGGGGGAVDDSHLMSISSPSSPRPQVIAGHAGH